MSGGIAVAVDAAVVEAGDVPDVTVVSLVAPMTGPHSPVLVSRADLSVGSVATSTVAEDRVILVAVVVQREACLLSP